MVQAVWKLDYYQGSYKQKCSQQEIVCLQLTYFNLKIKHLTINHLWLPFNLILCAGLPLSKCTKCHKVQNNNFPPLLFTCYTTLNSTFVLLSLLFYLPLKMGISNQILLVYKKELDTNWNKMSPDKFLVCLFPRKLQISLFCSCAKIGSLWDLVLVLYILCLSGCSWVLINYILGYGNAPILWRAWNLIRSQTCANAQRTHIFSRMSWVFL